MKLFLKRYDKIYTAQYTEFIEQVIQSFIIHHLKTKNAIHFSARWPRYFTKTSLFQEKVGEKSLENNKFLSYIVFLNVPL